MKVSLFITCLSDAMYPRVGEAMVRLLANTACSWSSRQSKPAVVNRL